MPTPKLKEIKHSLAKSRNELELLETILEERERLINVLQLTPSSNDNFELINQLDKTKKTLNYLQSDFIEYTRSILPAPSSHTELVNQVHEAINTYNRHLENDIIDSFIEADDYHIGIKSVPAVKTLSHKPSKFNDAQSVKSVRFRDQVDSDEESNELRNELMGTRTFKPYTDADDGDENGNGISLTNEDEVDQSFQDYETASETATLGSLNPSNQEMFASHQQQLLQQDTNLDQLHNSIRIQRSMGQNINDELDDHLILLNDLEQGVEDSQYRLGRAQNRLQSFRRKVRENGSLVTIIILTIILILLLVVLN